MGCTASHIEALKQGFRTGAQAFVVIEDDIDFNPTLSPKLMRSRVSRGLDSIRDWDVLMLTGTYTRGEITSTCSVPGFNQIKDYLCAAAYVVRRGYAPVLIERWSRDLDDARTCILPAMGEEALQCVFDHAVDVVWFKHQGRDRWLCASPVFFVIRVDYSDIEGTVVNHWDTLDVVGEPL